MNKHTYVLIALSVCLIGSLVLSGCPTGGTNNGNSLTGPGSVLVNQQVNVPGGGGGSPEILFSAESGQTIRITLTAVSPLTMQPYGWLEVVNPQGVGAYVPPLSTAANGVNSIDVTLDQTGLYALVVLDGANIGGTVQVRVDVI